MDQQAKQQTIQAIVSQELELERTKNEIATRKELIDEYVESQPLWLEVEAAKEELSRLKAGLDAALSGDGDYNDMLEDLGQLKDKQRSQKETLSDLVVGYRIETGEHQVELNNNGDARELVVTGRLGKKAKYQPSLFTEETEMT